MNPEHPLILLDVLEQSTHLSGRGIEDLDAHVASPGREQRTVVTEHEAFQTIDGSVDLARSRGRGHIEHLYSRSGGNGEAPPARVDRPLLTSTDRADGLCVGR